MSKTYILFLFQNSLAVTVTLHFTNLVKIVAKGRKYLPLCLKPWTPSWHSWPCSPCWPAWPSCNQSSESCHRSSHHLASIAKLRLGQTTWPWWPHCAPQPFSKNPGLFPATTGKSAIYLRKFSSRLDITTLLMIGKTAVSWNGTPTTYSVFLKCVVGVLIREGFKKN